MLLLVVVVVDVSEDGLMLVGLVLYGFDVMLLGIVVVKFVVVVVLLKFLVLLGCLFWLVLWMWIVMFWVKCWCWVF